MMIGLYQLKLIAHVLAAHVFYRATLCVSAVFAVVRRPSVTLVDCIHMVEDWRYRQISCSAW